MEKRFPVLLRRMMAWLLCAAMLLPVFPVSAFAAEETVAEKQTVITEADTVASSGIVEEDQLIWTVQKENYYSAGEVILLYGYWACNITTQNGFDQTVADSWTPFLNGEYKNYTAFIMEYLGSDNTSPYEFFVDAVIDGAKVDDVADEGIFEIQSHTSYGFVLLIPTADLTAETTPSRGDLVDTAFNHMHADYVKGYTQSLGNLTIIDNPVSSSQVSTVPASETASLNATVNLFNYDAMINDGHSGYSFWAGYWGYGGRVETLDGDGREIQEHRYPQMADTLDAEGYPQLSNGTSLAYLFNGMSFRENDDYTMVASMNNGGGLFQKDEQGYYYYDSLKNAAYYDASAGKFVLYEDLVVRPWYNSGNGADYEQKSDGSWGAIAPGGPVEAYGNFLPFNQVTTDNITIDGSVAHNITTGSAYPQGSLEGAGLNALAAGKVLAGTKALSTDVDQKIDDTITTARLEEKTDMWFGMTVDFEFFMPEGGLVDGEDMTFDFHGDDDVFVYVGVWNETTGAYDYKLVLDIGGVHAARSGKINFATGEVVDAPSTDSNGVHNDSSGYTSRNRTLQDIFGLEGETFADYTKLSLKFFYLERGGNISYCRLRFNIPTLPDKSLTVTKALTGDTDGVIDHSHDYHFRVVHSDNTSAPYFMAGTKYTILEKGVAVGTGTLKADGIFTLKAGQSAQFEHVLSNSTGGEKYILQELLPTGTEAQYRQVTCSASGAETVSDSAELTGYSVRSSGAMAADQTQTVVFRNEVDGTKLGSLSITKNVAPDAKETLADHIFRIEVTLDGTLIPVGTAYTVDGDSRTVETAGVIPLEDGQTAVITGILAGTEYVVRERNATGAYAPVFTGSVTDGTVIGGDESASGILPIGGAVSITVTNDVKDTDLVIDKTVEETDDPDKFTLTLEAYATGDTTSIVSTKPADIVLVVDQSASMYTPAGMTVDRLWAVKTENKDGNGNIITPPESAKITNFSAKVAEGDQTILENAKHTGYYVAVHNSGNYLYIVKYAEYKDGDTTKWGWFYVPVNVTTEPVTVTPNNTTDDTTKALTDGLTYAQPDKTILPDSLVTYYKTQYGELYDAIKKFVSELNSTGVDHKIAIVGFSSPFYDAMDHYSGTGLYIDGQYYLYDTDYKYKGYYNASGVLVRDDANGTVVLDPDTGFAGNTFAAVAASAEDTAFTPIGSNYANALVSVRSGLDSVNASIEAIQTNFMQTCPAVGIRMARNIFRGSDIPIGNNETVALDTSERDKIIVLFTDGVPTVSLETDYDNAVSEDVKEKYEYWHPLAGAASAINEATLAKNEGITIYTIGTGAAENLSIRDDQKAGDTDIPFLSVVSSNYTDSSASFEITYGTDTKGKPDSTSVGSSTYTVSKGTQTVDGAYANFTSSGTSLDIAFNSILSSVTTPSVDLNGNAVLKEVLSDYFDLDSNSTVDVKVYTQDYDPATGGWMEKKAFTAATVNLTSSDGSDRMDVIEVSGFDYHSNFVSNTPHSKTDESEPDYYGSKLVVEVTIERRSGFWGGNNVPTNKNTTGIYSGGVVVEKFPIPEANVPLDLQVVAKDKTIYYGADVTARDLIDGVTADGHPVTVLDDGTFSPEAEWMDDYADLAWTDESTRPTSEVSNVSTDDYTFAITMTPAEGKDGANNQSGDPGNIAGDPVSGTGITASDSGHVYILAPQVTFKDSSTEVNTAAADYDYTTNDYVSTAWVHMDTTVPDDAPAVSGDAPTLTLTYVPELDTFTVDTRVNVEITSSLDTDDVKVANATTYLWENCVENLHNNAVHGTIGTHKATADSYEFWIHVPDDDDTQTGLSLNKQVDEGDSANQFVLTLDAYAKGNLVNVTKPADIVLVLDHSGSMRTPVGAPSVLHSPSGDYAGEVYTGAGSLTKDQLDTDKGQHIGYYVAQSTSTKWWFVMEYDADTAQWIGYSVPSTEAIVNPDQPVGSAATEHTKVQKWSYADIPAQLVFYKTQYGMLYDEVSLFVKNLKDSGVDHRVAIVGFSSSANQGTFVYVYRGEDMLKNYDALHMDSTSQERRDYLYQAAMKRLQDESQYQELTNAINDINTNHSFTCPAAGLQLGNEIFAANEVNPSARDRIMVLFTDGIPNVKIGQSKIVDSSDPTILDEIVQKAYVAKQTYGVQVYCIGTTTLGTSEHDRTFLNYTSSNYPDAVSMTDYGAPGEKQIYNYHGSTAQMNLAFQQIQQESANSFVKLDKSTVLREVLSDYVMLDDAATVQYKVYTQDYLGGGRWGDLDEFTEAEGMKHTLTSSDGSARMDTIEISGFDYNECYISETARAKTEGGAANYYGTKLVLKVWIESRTGFWGGNNVPTNKNETAIYLDGKVVEPFPMPEVNIPIDVEITTKDKTIYYGNDVTGGDLIDKITVNGSEVEIDGDTLKPTEEWMDDFSEIKWTENSTKPSTDLSGTDPKDYTFGVQVTPTKDGENNSQATNPGNIAGDPVPTEGDTDDSTGHVYIKVPTVTFQDSSIDFGATPDDAHYSANDVVKNEDETVKVEWTFLEDTDTADAPDVTGDEPTLSLTYQPIGDGSFAFDTPVDVTVSSSNGADISDVTTFDWENCEHKLHDEGVIPSHTASAADQAEFYVHVEIQIQPDTVVIDYGLPVDIDVLANDPVYENVNRVFAGIAAKDTSAFAGENVPGVYGVLSVNGDGTVRYTLNTSNGMQMEKEDVFAYGVTYTKNGTERTLPSTVTIIPATTIYYEDGFLTYSVIDDDTGEAVENYGWTEVKDKNYDPDAVQAEDRPGPDVTALDADNIYGYDGAYTAMTEYSLGSAAMVNVGYKYNNDGTAVMVNHDGKQEPLRTTAIAEFTFSGTGFDVVSLTSAQTGTILVEVQGVTDASFNEIYIVDTYYGYKQVNGEWVVDPDASDALYQVPVMKVDGLTYGKYNVKIIASWAELFDHEQYGDKQNYDFYLDAIRIYDPANDGAGNKVIEDAYVDDGEGWPEYFELRDLLIKANDFNSLDGGDKASGIVFIDNSSDSTGKVSYSVADYKNYGPNNELYLAKDQAVTFTLNVGEVVNGESNVAGIHIAMKSTGGTAKAVIKKTSGGSSSAEQVLEQEIKTATDLYYDITAANGYTVVIKNTGDDILSITNIKVTYKSAHEDSIENDYFRVTKSGVQDALNLLAEDDLRVTSGALTPESATLSLEDEVHYNIYFSSTTGASAENMGLLVWDSKPASPSYANADEIYAGVTADGNRFKVTTDGIPAKEMGDTKYFMLYAKNTDGTYTYSEMFEYSAKQYALSRLANSNDAKLKNLCVALLNYGAAAQTYFGYRTSDLMNASLTDAQKAMVTEYSADLLDDVGTVAEEKIGEYAATAGAYIAKQATVTLGGALELNFYFTPSKTTDAITLYYWNEAAYASEGALSSITPTGTIEMENNGGKFRGTVTGIAAKNMDDTIYVCGVYEVDGVKYYTGIIPYSIASYCEKKAANGDEAIVPLAEATAVYGYYAKTYFAP